MAERLQDPLLALDLTGRRTISELQDNARISYTALSPAVNLSPSACLTKVRALHQRGVIARFTVEIDHGALGYDFFEALVSARIHPGSGQLMKTTVGKLQQLPMIFQFSILGSTEDFLIDIRARNVDYVRKFVLKNLSPDPAVALAETNLIFEHHTARGDLPVL
ncbi:Lrp/AsnC family transcriptional regulator [Nesterenkonia ebinurensis]|uniref:Lrp/AsnC family transcriptional regulator n=1 Tax=Nesterenkonia ebinurensis TaxID=2608252 RepID=UPI00123D0E43|nr:Lrp/AsnC family transcriptional regulator [Nesterenkonia ebinurensis]